VAELMQTQAMAYCLFQLMDYSQHRSWYLEYGWLFALSQYENSLNGALGTQTSI
jgi:hypothetical protein